MQDRCGGLDDNGLHSLIYMNTSSPVDTIVWVGLSLGISKDSCDYQCLSILWL